MGVGGKSLEGRLRWMKTANCASNGLEHYPGGRAHRMRGSIAWVLEGLEEAGALPFFLSPDCQCWVNNLVNTSLGSLTQ